MPHRSYASTANYRFGFNGKENDNESKGLGNQQDYGMRVYDPRIGRFLSTDPLQDKYPDLSVYQFGDNTPIQAVDLDGLEKVHYSLTYNNKNEPILIPTGKIDYTYETGIIFKETHKWEPQAVIHYDNNTYNFSLHNTENPEIHQNHPEEIKGNYNIADLRRFLASKGDGFVSEEKSKEFSNVQAWLSTAESISWGVTGSVRQKMGTNIWSQNRNGTTDDGTNKQSVSIHNGNTESANANIAAKPSITYNEKEYEINSTVPYKRPNNATTVAQRKAANQTNSECATCGTKVGPFVADHITPLAIEFISTGTIDKKKMRSISATQSQCAKCSLDQSAAVRKASQSANKKIKENQKNKKGG